MSELLLLLEKYYAVSIMCLLCLGVWS